MFRKERKYERNRSVDHPNGGAAERLPFEADLIGEDFTYIDPDDSARGERKAGNVLRHKENQRWAPMSGHEDVGDPTEPGDHAGAADSQQCPSSQLVDQGH